MKIANDLTELVGKTPLVRLNKLIQDMLILQLNLNILILQIQ